MGRPNFSRSTLGTVMRFGFSLRLYPGRFFGVFTGYDPVFVEAIRALPMRVWDQEKRAWWLAETNWLPVRMAAQKTGVISEETLTTFESQILHPARTNKDSSEIDEAYEILGVQRNAPPGLVKRAYEFWTREFAGAGGTGYQQARLDSAYTLIMAGA